MREAIYQAALIKKLRDLFPEAIIMKSPSEYLQGVPDLIILYEDRWATLEVKTSPDADERPNQRHYVTRMNEMSYSAFIYPENEAQVLNELQQAFHPRRKTRVSKPK